MAPILEIGLRLSKSKPVSVGEYLTCDIDQSKHPDIVADATCLPVRNGCLGGVIITEVIEHIEFPERAVSEIHRTLASQGVCLLSTRFLYPYHPGPSDFWRFTIDSLRSLFREFKNLEIQPQGGTLVVVWQLISSGRFNPLRLLNPLISLIDRPTPVVASGFIVYAVRE